MERGSQQLDSDNLDLFIKTHIRLPEEEKHYLGVLTLQLKRTGDPLVHIYNYMKANQADSDQTMRAYELLPEEILAITSLIKRFEKYFEADFLVRTAPMIDHNLRTLDELAV